MLVDHFVHVAVVARVNSFLDSKILGGRTLQREREVGETIAVLSMWQKSSPVNNTGLIHQRAVENETRTWLLTR